MKRGCMDTKGKLAPGGMVVVHRHYKSWADVRRALKHMVNTNKYKYATTYFDTEGPSILGSLKENTNEK